MDASSINYKLEEVISKEKVADDVTFSIPLKPTLESSVPTYISGDINSGFELLETIGIRCNELCDQLSEKLQSSENLTGIFKYTDSDNIELVDLRSAE